MKLLRYIWMFLLAGLFTACTDDFIDDPHHSDWAGKGDGISISVSSDDMVPVNMNQSRANTELNSILSTIDNLNIRVHAGKEVHTVYIGKDNQIHHYKTVKSPTAVNGEAYWAYPNQYNKLTDALTMVHFDKIIASTVTKVEVLGNAGDQHATADWSTITETQLLNPNTPTCMMYGVATAPSEAGQGDIAHTTPAGKCKLFKIKLRRSTAIVSLAIDGTQLNDNVFITPQKVTLFNVPKSCQITALGHADGEFTGNQITTKEQSISTHEMELHFGTVSKTGKPHLGKHLDGTFDKNDPKNEFIGFIQYENTQPTHASANETVKYPAGVKSVADAKDPAKNFKCSYIELVADYKYKNKGTVKVGGPIIYRFFLGSNITDNFSVEGNHYYKLTLNLKGFGGAKEDGKVDSQGNLVVNKEDASWRVDMNTSDWGFEKDQYDFDCHYLDGKANVVGNAWTLTGGVAVGDGAASWLVFQNKKGEWVNPTTIEKGVELNIVNGQVSFQIEPMTYLPYGTLDPSGQFDVNTYKDKVNYRAMTITVQKKGSNETQNIVVRQYAPITVYLNGSDITNPSKPTGDFVFMERFEEYGADAQGNTIIGYPWKYEGHNLQNLTDRNGFTQNYHYSNPSKDYLGWNANYLSPKVINGVAYQDEGRGSAAEACYLKSFAKFQGASSYLYALPSEAYFKAMCQKSALAVPEWGPFEPIHIYEDYWTSTVYQEAKTKTVFYDGTNQGYASTPNRNELKRVRALYTHQLDFGGGDD